jgi:enoyl-CoA hydratase/carnithine racemase
MSGFQAIIYEKRDGIGYITLNRPRFLNVYNLQMRDELFQVLSAIKDDGEVEVVVLKGAGEKAFCAGADLTEFLSAPSPVIARQVRWERDLWGLFLTLPQPIIAALHGYVFGSGIEMALCCDLRIASEDVQFAVPEGTLGIIPAAGATQTLPRTAGRAKALEALLTGERINAQEALRTGLVTRVVPRSELTACAEDIAHRIMRRPPTVVRAIKTALRRGLDMSLASGLQMERHLYLSALSTS